MLFQLHQDCDQLITEDGRKSKTVTGTSTEESLRLMMKKAITEAKLQNLLESATSEFIELWRYIQVENSRLIRLIEILRRVYSRVEKIESMYNSNSSMLMQSPRIIWLYGFFNLMVLNRPHIGDPMIDNAKEIIRKILKTNYSGLGESELIDLNKIQFPAIIVSLERRSIPIAHYNKAFNAALRITRDSPRILNLADLVPVQLKNLYLDILSEIGSSEHSLKMFFQINKKAYIKEMLCIAKVITIFNS